MNLNKLIFTENACYKAGKKIKVQGIMVHSTGANNPNLKRYVGPDDGKLGKNIYNNHWNQTMDRNVCVHGFIGKLNDGSIATYQTLPWDHRGWHAGGAANDTHTSFEICEDDLTNESYFKAVYKEAIELCTHLCDLYDLDPTKNGVIIGHYEGHQRGLASNHGDPRHWFSRFGKSMDNFREDVKYLLIKGGEDENPKIDEPPKKLAQGYYRVRKSWEDNKSQLGAYKILANAKRKADENQGYFVFNEDGTKIYPKEEVTSIAGQHIHIVKSGDSLWKIAREYLGDGSRYPEIKLLNALTSNTIYAGQKLKIPVSAFFKVGDKVTVSASCYSTGETIPKWVKERTHIISQVEKTKVLLGWPDGICSWVPLDGVKKI
ncbi:MAG: N-acetylmuramoyl-L-alanine amidase [Saccharofermentanales bacterium]|jgi:LysM repeat protein